MLTRQESSLSASRRQAAAATTPPPSKTHHAKSIGCMSGIFKLFSRYQNPNKRITFGRKQEKWKPTKSRQNHPPPAAKDDKTEDRATLQTEIEAAENSRTPPPTSLVARLMGLEDLGAAVKKEPAGNEEGRLTEKRRLLLDALEKCNEDLEALKRIIEAVETKDVRIHQSPRRPGGGDLVAEEANELLTRSPSNNSFSCPVQNSTAGDTRVKHERKPIAAKKPGEDDEPIITKLPCKSASIESSLSMRRQAAAAPTWCSRAMVKSVEEVCGDIAWGEKREIGRIGLALQDHLCRELIEELVKELKPCSIPSLPFDACKRRLCF